MSRKKKKKQKQQQRVLEQQTLNGWNCPAVELGADEADIDSEEEELAGEQTQPSAAPEAPPEPEPAPVPVHQPGAQPTAEEIYWKLVEEYTRQAQAAEAARGPQQPPAPPAEQLTMQEAAQAAAEAPEPPEETVQPATAQSQEPAAAPAPKAPEDKPTLKQRLTGVFAAPRRTPQEQAEDMEKFGGLEDAPTEAAAELPAPVQQPKAAAAIAKTGGRLLTAGRQEAARARMGLSELWEWAYNECYYLGIQLQRYASDLRRRAFKASVWFRYTIPPFFSQKRQQLHRMLDSFSDSCLEPFRDIAIKTRSMRYQMHHPSEEPFPNDRRHTGRVGIFARYLYSLGKPINRMANFVLPILGCAVLAAVILYFQQVNYALEVEYAGVNMGYVQKESEFYQAKQIVADRLMSEEFIPLDNSNPKFTLTIVEPGQLTPVETLANRIMSTSKNEVSAADGIYIDNAFLGAVEDGNEFLLYIDGILDNYRTDTDNERVQFVKKVEVQRGIYPTSSLRQVHEIKNAVESNQSVPQLHKVAEGETLETLAEQNNTTVKAIVKLNPRLEQQADLTGNAAPSLSVGEEIMISKVELSLGIQVTRREVYTESIDFGTEYVEDNTQLESYQVVLTSGVPGKREVTSDFTYIDGEKISETRISTEVVQEPRDAKVKKGTLKPTQFLPATSDSGASFMWPVAGGYLSAGLYGYYGHTGMDIAAPYGTGIYAARSGTVTAAYNYTYGAYGRRVDINHGNGVMSRYAHCSEVLVQPGQYVKMGQLIAKVGRTGNAYGNHCHFEIRINGRVMDPADFIGKKYPGGY